MLASAQQIVSDEIKEKIQTGLRKSSWKPRRRSSEMANAINTLLSLRDPVRIKAPWSSSGQNGSSSSSSSGALNLGLLSNSASLMQEMESSFEQTSPVNGTKNYSSRDRQRSPDSLSPDIENNKTGNIYVNGGSSNSFGNADNERLTPTEIIDELSYIYPQEDFSLLRIACLKNEITLTKLSSRLGFSAYPDSNSPPTSSMGGVNGNGSLSDNYVTQQTFQLLKQQNDYMQMLQQSGVFPGDTGNGLNLSSLADSANPKFPWFHPLAQAAAAAAGISLPSSTSNSRLANGGGTRSKKKNSQSAEGTDSHVFISPKYPVSSSKPKTVAAALAASRHSPSTLSGVTAKGRKPATGNKRRPARGKQSISAPYYQNEDGTVDPSSLVEVTQSDENSVGDGDYGMDLSTPDLSQKRSNGSDMCRNLTMADSLMHDGELPLTNNSDVLSAASMSLENYLRDAGAVISQKGLNGTTTVKIEPNADASDVNLSESERNKRQVLDAFTSDPDVAGDARGVARKFGLNIRMVLKWLREGPSKSLPALPSNHANAMEQASDSSDSKSDSAVEEHGLNNNGNDQELSEGLNNNYRVKAASNRRKKAKPNQICDFEADDVTEDADPLDMVVPIKKRRLSSSNAP